jgi:hypothetical protein
VENTQGVTVHEAMDELLEEMSSFRLRHIAVFFQQRCN